MMTLNLQPLLPHLPAWALVLFRLAGIFMFGPVFGSQVVPARVKVFLALGLSFCVYPMLLDADNPSAASLAPVIQSAAENDLHLWPMVAAVASEIMIGLIIGFGANLPIVGVQVGGYMIDQQMGLGIAQVFNPELNAESGVVSQFLTMCAIGLFVIIGGHRVMLAALVGSFHHVPLGGFMPDAAMVDLIVGLLTAMFELAVRVAAPLLCIFFLLTLALGFIARTVPQLNILSIGFGLRIIVGAVVLVFLSAMFGNTFIMAATRMLTAVTRFFNPLPM